MQETYGVGAKRYNASDDEARLGSVGLPKLFPVSKLGGIAGSLTPTFDLLHLTGHRVSERQQVITTGKGELYCF